MIKCDHCRRDLGHTIHRYWQMRFCSPACVEAYRGRLDDGTRTKIQQLDFAAAGNPRRTAPPWLAGLIQRLPR
jgi:hypothetical protein